MDPPLSEDEGALQQDDAQQDETFISDEHTDYPEGFLE